MGSGFLLRSVDYFVFGRIPWDYYVAFRVQSAGSGNALWRQTTSSLEAPMAAPPLPLPPQIVGSIFTAAADAAIDCCSCSCSIWLLLLPLLLLLQLLLLLLRSSLCACTCWACCWACTWACAKLRTCRKRPPLFSSRAWCSCALARKQAIELFLQETRERAGKLPVEDVLCII